MPKTTKLSAKWIWKKQASYNPYQQVIVARKTVRLGNIAQGDIKITTDGWYRLLINGVWVNDGPSRSWPEHFQYDVLDITAYLVEGENEFAVIARHWSVGNFHTVPRQAGLLAQIDVLSTAGQNRRISSDRTWQVAEAPAWLTETPKVSIQMEPQELYDARWEDDLVFEPAAELFAAGDGPWQDLQPRDTALLTRVPLALKRFLGANVVRRINFADFCVPTARLANPGLIEANHSVGNNGGMATVLTLDRDETLRIVTEGFLAAVDGRISEDGIYVLGPGNHILLAFSSHLTGHDKDRSLRLVEPPASMRLSNPLSAEYGNPWCWIAMPDFNLRSRDMPDFRKGESGSGWMSIQGQGGEREQLEAGYRVEIVRLLENITNLAAFQAELEPQASLFPTNEMFTLDTHAPFLAREVIGGGAPLVQNPAGLMYDNSSITVVQPSGDGDVELVYDLGEQSIGYYELDLVAEAGVEVDIFGVEYIAADGTIQHTWANRNGMRYITREGTNHFTSLKRRSQRYLFITLRQQTQPVRIRKIGLIESTYPVEQSGFFECSDARLEQIYEISARTLKLCMEDTFTDCPLYEQTHWVGDARNEALFNFSTFGAQDIVKRCIRLTAQSLERYPIAGCQVPSCWDTLLPAWSFLWGISVWDYYQYSGDREFLKELWPAVMQNLHGAESLLDERGLFSGSFWNMFDWSGIDDRHATVLHNSMFVVGAIDAALEMAKVLAKRSESKWLADFRRRLAGSIEACWDGTKNAYPDSILEDGTPSPSTSVHTSFLALLYNLLPPERVEIALRNTLQPPEGMVRVGSPFAILYQYEALEKAGLLDAILASIYQNYLPMLEEGATTVWEVFSTSNDRPSGFPTRSHCHAWSSAPLTFLPRIVLGVRPAGIGGMVYEISPRLGELSWARGATASALGPVKVEWKREGQRLMLRGRAPQGVVLRYVENETLKGLQVELDLG